MNLIQLVCNKLSAICCIIITFSTMYAFPSVVFGGLVPDQFDANTSVTDNVTSLGERNTASKVAAITMTTMISMNTTIIKQLE